MYNLLLRLACLRSPALPAETSDALFGYARAFSAYARLFFFARRASTSASQSCINRRGESYLKMDCNFTVIKRRLPVKKN